MRSGPYSTTFPERAIAGLVTQGILRLDPDGSLWWKMRTATSRLARWVTPVLGSQAVVSWHATTGLASKALGAEHVAADKGDVVSIRTDIQITETKKRGA